MKAPPVKPQAEYPLHENSPPRAADSLASELAACQPQAPLEELVVAVNRLFHDVEAQHYDVRHPEVHQQLPPLWREMIDAASAILPGQTWRALDFGCGTGFASLQALAAAPVESLACVDLSPAMLEVCRHAVAPRAAAQSVSCQFATDATALAPPGSFNALLTNSLVHHLPSLASLRQQVEPLLAPRAVWLCGHEPSRRFYAQAECLELVEAYRRWQRGPAARWRRLWDAAAWRRRWQRTSRRAISPKAETARRAVDAGLFRSVPSAQLIDRLVDFHVAHSAAEAQSGRGLDIEEMAADLAPHWRLVWRRNYAYLGPYYEASAPAAWRQRAAELARRFPDAGANFCAVLERTA